ncbi:hypothetical protein, partial [Klebsiella variicola]|uniref:hypothetical protein n=1 Tax=Klebsiella variicola TaxID=244366 RepID=UPI001C43C304
LLHGDVLMWLMKTLLTSGCTNQRGAGQTLFNSTWLLQALLMMASFASPYCWGISVCGLVVEFFADRKENIRHGELLKVQ